MAIRKIIKIDEEKCDGCGACIIDCAEGALAIVNGKAKLVGDVLCDGLGACLGGCPTGALELIEREADEFDEETVEKHLAARGEAKPASACPSTVQTILPAGAKGALPCGCPSSHEKTLTPSVNGSGDKVNSALGHWPVQLQLVNPAAPFLKGAELLLLADCTAVAYPNLHADLLPGKAVVMACPKLDNLEAHIEKLTAVLTQSGAKSLTVVHMDVPCCRGIVYAVEEAIKRSRVDTPVNRLMINPSGQIVERDGAGEAA